MCILFNNNEIDVWMKDDNNAPAGDYRVNDEAVRKKELNLLDHRKMRRIYNFTRNVILESIKYVSKIQRILLWMKI